MITGISSPAHNSAIGFARLMMKSKSVDHGYHGSTRTKPSKEAMSVEGRSVFASYPCSSVRSVVHSLHLTAPAMRIIFNINSSNGISVEVRVQPRPYWLQYP